MSDITRKTGADKLLAIMGLTDTPTGCILYTIDMRSDACEARYTVTLRDTAILDMPKLHALRSFRTPSSWKKSMPVKCDGAYEWGLDWNKAITERDAVKLHSLLSALGAPVVGIRFDMLNIDADL